MKYASLFGLMLSFVLLTGCASTTDTTAAKETPACASCAAGEKCADCAAEAAKCETCATKNAKCATCAAGKKCTECAGEKKEACATCASGEAFSDCKKKTEKADKSVAVPISDEPIATIEAKGMGCPLCASSADRRLKKIDGVTWTNIDLGNGLVTVGLDPNKPTPEAEDLQNAIRDAGFTADAVTLPTEGSGE
ncbi:MAG: heavy metal-associated domain-containing protein [Planctomycetota bacterium]